MSEIKFNNTSVELRENNAYRDGVVIEFPDGDLELERDVVDWVGSENDRYYTVRFDDDLDKIAWKMYKDIVEKADFYWWVIADANQIENPLDISDYIGKQLVVPDLQIFLLTKENNG